jgi:hypothetical protein
MERRCDSSRASWCPHGRVRAEVSAWWGSATDQAVETGRPGAGSAARPSVAKGGALRGAPSPVAASSVGGGDQATPSPRGSSQVAILRDSAPLHDEGGRRWANPVEDTMPYLSLGDRQWRRIHRRINERG